MLGLAKDRPTVLGCDKSLGFGLVHGVSCEVASSRSTWVVSPNYLPNSFPGDEDFM